jgi:hypothetical protein
MRSPSTAFSAILALACALFLYFENQGGYFGRLTNRFDPCLANPSVLTPCYAATSTDAMLTVALIGVTALVVLLFGLSTASRA